MGNKPNNIRVFLSETSKDVEQQRLLLEKVLYKAGMDVVDLAKSKSLEQLLGEAQCSIHLIGRNYEATIDNSSLSVVEQQFELAQQRRQPDEEFKIFVWQPWQDNKDVDKRQESFMNNVRNSILQNMVYSKQESPVLFVEDIRSMMQQEMKTNQKTSEADLFFIHNELDEESGKDIGNLLGDVLEIERLSLQMQSGMQNADFVVEQMLKSKLAVIYFEKTINWAVPFVQQVWKKIGGASSPIDILLIGEADVAANQNLVFDAPKVHPLVIPKELVPLEIKVQFDKLLGTR